MQSKVSRTVDLCADFQIATYNALAIGEADVTDTLPGPRSVRLDYQFHEARLAIVRIQEARTPAGTRMTDHYRSYSSGFSACGSSRHFGCEIWVHKTLPIVTSNGESLSLGEADVFVLSSDPRALLVHIEGVIDLYVAVCHAPCTSADRSVEQVSVWWQSLSNIIRPYCHHSNFAILIDANAPLADSDTQFFGMHGAEPGIQAGTLFQQFLVENELSVPSALGVHTGIQATWRHPRCSMLTRDYVVFNRKLVATASGSKVLTGFDGGFGHVVHRNAVVKISAAFPSPHKNIALRWDQDRLKDPVCRQRFESALSFAAHAFVGDRCQ